MSFKKNIVLTIILLFFLLSTVPVFAYWEMTYQQSAVTKTGNVQIGTFLYGNMKPYSPTETYSKGDLVMKNGTIYIADITIYPSDEYHDPEITNTNAFKAMRYRESSNLYVRYNRYLPSDYVVYGGKTYQLIPPNYHDPNTLRQISPGDSEQKVWKEVSDTVLNTWYRYKVYYRGDKINYNGIDYICLEDECNQINPSNSQYWQPI